MKTQLNKDRRNFLRLAWPAGVLLLNPGFVFADSKKAKSKTKASRALGECLSLACFQKYGSPHANDDIQKYTSLVGNAVVRNLVNPNHSYHFVVIDSPQYSTFGFPGGIIVISSTLFKSLKTESELACILAHEVSHVHSKHALYSIDKSKLTADKGKDNFNSIITQLQSILFEKGLSSTYEFEADKAGMKLAYRTGYNPDGLQKSLERLVSEKTKKQTAGHWITAHPACSDRISGCKKALKQYPDYATMAVNSDRFVSFRNKI